MDEDGCGGVIGCGFLLALLVAGGWLFFGFDSTNLFTERKTLKLHSIKCSVPFKNDKCSGALSLGKVVEFRINRPSNEIVQWVIFQDR